MERRERKADVCNQQRELRIDDLVGEPAVAALGAVREQRATDEDQRVRAGPASQSNADAGAPKLATCVNPLKPDHISAGPMTLIDHRSGATRVGDAFTHSGRKADDVIFAGAPGVTVGKASDLHLDPHHV
ncbi:hypothetical protein I3F55_07470 [Streptomyces sp. MUM 16J]|nr:hypothetical protein [Streptomyces sp. MUM 16J]